MGQIRVRELSWLAKELREKVSDPFFIHSRY